MRGFVGIGQADIIEQAVDEATRGLRNADLIILTAPYEKAEKAAMLIHQKYPLIPMIGTTGEAMTKQGYTSGAITVTALAGVEVCTGIIEDIKTHPIKSIRAFNEDAQKIDAKSTNTICMEFTTGSEDKLLSTIKPILKKYGISMLGGSASNAPLGCKNMVIHNGMAYNRSCVYAFIKNNAGKIKLFSENIYEKLTGKPHFVTTSDTNTNSLFQLDEQSAFDVYMDETGVDKEHIINNMTRQPFGRAIGDELQITATGSLDMNGVMFTQKTLYENDKVYVMNAGDYRQIHSEFVENIKNSCTRISFIYGFESKNRIKLFDEEGYTNDMLNEIGSLGNYICHLSDGQQFMNQQHNQTLVCVVFE